MSSPSAATHRDGFVAVFRQYEGMPTDERTLQGRVVKVTITSFAEHIGIPTETFRRWVKAVASAVTTPQPRSTDALGRDVKRAATAAPSSVVSGIMAAPAAVQDEIFHELKLRRAGIDTSPAARKASNAHAHEAVAPFRSAIAAGHVTLCVQALRDALDSLNEAAEAGVLNDETMGEIVAAFEEFSFGLAQARFAVSP